MSENKDRKIITAKGGVFTDLVMRIKLIVRLMGDARVNPLLKLLPVGALAYFIVQEHMQAINQVIPGAWENPKEMDGEIIEGEYWDKKE
jgi:hypothetical protein